MEPLHISRRAFTGLVGADAATVAVVPVGGVPLGAENGTIPPPFAVGDETLVITDNRRHPQKAVVEKIDAVPKLWPGAPWMWRLLLVRPTADG